MAITVTGLTTHTQTGGGTWLDYGGGGGSAANTEVFLSSTGSRARKVSNGVKGFAFEVNATGTDLSATVICIRWATLAGVGVLNSLANSGVVIRLEDTAGNQSDWAVHGNDTYTGGWEVSTISTSNTETSNSGTAATLTAIRYVGIVWDETGNVGGGDPNCYIDEILSWPNTGLTVSGNTTSLISDLQAWDDTGDYGIIQTRSEITFCKAPLILAPDATSIDSTGEFLVFEDPFYYDGTNIDAALTTIGLSSTDSDPIDFVRLVCRAATGSTINGTDVSRTIDFSAATNVTADVVSFFGFDAATNPFRLGGSGNDYTSVTWNTCGQVTDTGAVIRDSIFRNATDANGAYEWTTSTNMQDTSFFSDGTGHGIDIASAATSPTTTAFVGIVGSGYGANDTANALVDNNTGHNVAIAASGGSSGITVNTTANTTVANTVSVSVEALDVAGDPITGAVVLLEADTGGDLPARESVTITRTGSVATVSHTAHGVPTGTEVIIRGADQSEYNGIRTVTVTGANSYTFTVTGTPATPATGTITSSSVIVAGTTTGTGIVSTASFNYTNDQDVTGRVRKSTTSPLYKQAPLTGTVTANGLSLTVAMVSDE